MNVNFIKIAAKKLIQSPAGFKRCDNVLLQSMADIAKCNNYYKVWQYTKHTTLYHVIYIRVGA